MCVVSEKQAVLEKVACPADDGSGQMRPNAPLRRTRHSRVKNWKAYTPFSRKELDLIDKWGFVNRIRNRADAVRSSVMKASASEGTHLLSGPLAPPCRAREPR